MGERGKEEMGEEERGGEGEESYKKNHPGITLYHSPWQGPWLLSRQLGYPSASHGRLSAHQQQNQVILSLPSPPLLFPRTHQVQPPQPAWLARDAQGIHHPLQPRPTEATPTQTQPPHTPCIPQNATKQLHPSVVQQTPLHVDQPPLLLLLELRQQLTRRPRTHHCWASLPATGRGQHIHI